MSLLQRRYIKLVVDTLDVSELHCEFVTKHDLTENPNTLELVVYNLSPDHRAQLSTVALNKDGVGVAVELYVGYEDNGEIDVRMLFKGRLRTVSHQKQNQDWITKITSGTGDELQQVTGFSFGPGASILDVVKTYLKEINYVTEKTSLGAALDIKLPAGGFASFGKRGDELQRILTENGMSFSIQNETLQILGANQTTNDTLLVLGAENGMVGSPEIIATNIVFDEDRKTRRVQRTIRVTSLLNPALYPGRQLEVVSTAFIPYEEHVYFRIEKAESHGSSFDTDFFTVCEAKELLV